MVWFQKVMHLPSQKLSIPKVTGTILKVCIKKRYYHPENIAVDSLTLPSENNVCHYVHYHPKND